MKIILCLAFLLSVSLNSIAQYKIDMDIPGFWGVPFKSTKEQVKKLMSEKNDCIFGAFDNESNTLIYIGGNFAGYKVESSGFKFYNDCFYFGFVVLESTSEKFVITNYKTLKRDLTTKYTLPTLDIEDYKFPFKKGDSEQTEAIKLGKADFQTHWMFKHAVILLKINSDLKIMVGYSDTMIRDIVDKLQNKENSKDL